MDTSMWESAIEAQMVFDGWRRIATDALRTLEGATLTQYWVLLHLTERKIQPLSAMVDELELNYTTIAECVARLKDSGYVETAESEEDHRMMLASLTPEGTMFFKHLDRELTQVARRALAPLSGHGRIQTMTLLYSACFHLQKNRIEANLARGDSAFLITCQQISMNFATICKRNLVTPQQGQLLLIAANRATPLSAKEARELLAFDASTLSRTLSRIEAAGLAKRQKGISKREVEITITSLGFQSASAIASETDTMLRTLFGEDYESETFRQTIAALRLSLQDATEKDSSA